MPLAGVCCLVWSGEDDALSDELDEFYFDLYCPHRGAGLCRGDTASLEEDGASPWSGGGN